MSIHYEEMTTKPQTCHNCGGTIESGWGSRVEEWGYPWDGSDGEGSITEKLNEWYECALGRRCIEAACQSGVNLTFLRGIATGQITMDTDRPFPTDMRETARLAYNKFAGQNRTLREALDSQADGAMREAGFGAIGGGRGR